MIDSADPYIFILLVVLFLSREHITWVWFHTLSSTWFFFLSPAFDVGKREVGRNSSDPRHQAARRTLPDPPIESLDRGCLLPHERGSPFRVANICCLDGCNFRLNGPLFAYWISVDIDPVNELHSALFFQVENTIAKASSQVGAHFVTTENCISPEKLIVPQQAAEHGCSSPGMAILDRVPSRSRKSLESKKNIWWSLYSSEFENWDFSKI